jgi:hypothetical protein
MGTGNLLPFVNKTYKLHRESWMLYTKQIITSLTCKHVTMQMIFVDNIEHVKVVS